MTALAHVYSQHISSLQNEQVANEAKKKTEHGKHTHKGDEESYREHQKD